MISVIVVNYEKYEDTFSCVESILKSETTQEFKIVVVDNASPNDSWEKLQVLKNNEKIVLLKSEENNGYCAGNNIGIKYSLKKLNADYVWILNPDTIVDNHAMQNLFDFQENHDECGILGCKLVYYPDTQYLQGLGGGMFEKNQFGALVPKTHLYHMYDSNVILPKVVKLDLIIGASMFIKSLVFKRCGLMDDRFHLYSDETEFCLRVTKFGFKNYAISGATVYHKEGWRQTTQKKIATYYGTRNSLYMTEMLFPENLKNHLFMQHYLLFRKFLSGVKHKNFSEYKLLKKALQDFKHHVYGPVDLTNILERSK